MHKHELQKRRAALLDSNTAILAEAQREGRDLTAGERDTIRQNLIAADALQSDIAMLEEQSRASASLDVVEKRVIAGPTFVNIGNDGPAMPTSGGGRSQGRGARFADLFGATGSLASHGFRDEEDFLTAVARGDGGRLTAAAFKEGQGSLGGFSVPTPLSAAWLDAGLEREVVRPRARVFPMSSDSLKIAGWDDSDRSSSRFGGVAGVWAAEASTGTDQTGHLRLVTLQTKKLIAYAAASNELCADGQGFADQLGQALREELSFSMDYSFLRGTGAGQPLGILNSDATIVVAKEAGQAADTIMVDNLAAMAGRLLPSSWHNAVWVCSPSVVPKLMLLTITVGTGGSYVPAVRDMGSGAMIFGRPLLVSEKLPALGNEGDILLADFSCYGVGIRQEISLDRSNAPAWHEDEMSFRAVVRVDGQPLLSGPITPRNGGDTLSPFVTLAERA